MPSLLTSDPQLRSLIDSIARFVAMPSWEASGLWVDPGALLEGLVLTESSGRPSAIRYEPHQDREGRKDQRGDQDVAGRDDGMLEDDKSYGLCQVMGYTIKHILGMTIVVDGVKLPDPAARINFSFALEPSINLTLGCLWFLQEFKAVNREDPRRGHNECIARALARYNGGPSGDDGDPFRLQGYVDKVAKNCLLAIRDRIAVSWAIRRR